MTTHRGPETDYAVPTGQMLQEWMQENGRSLEDVSQAVGWTRWEAQQFLEGKRSLWAGEASRLEAVTGVQKEFWLRFEVQYQADRHRLGL